MNNSFNRNNERHEVEQPTPPYCARALATPPADYSLRSGSDWIHPVTADLLSRTG